VEVTGVVRKCKPGDGKKGKPWCLYAKDGHSLGAHASKQDAYKQEYAIQKSKESKAVASVLIDVGLELQRRRSPVAAEVLAAAADLTEDLSKQLKRAGFTNPMKRDEDVAEQVAEDKIPILPPIDETAQ
jgi:hypothetical protein